MIGLSDLARLYEAFLVDQFGVLHDGREAFPGAVDGLARLKAAGKTVFLLSNSGRPAAPNAERLKALGFQDGSYDALITSGDVARQKLTAMLEDGTIASGARCLLLAREAYTSPVDGLGLTVTDDAGEADIVLIAGSRSEDWPIEHYVERLRPAAERGIQAFCSNPDKLMLTKLGLRYGPGVIGERYEAMGGAVTWLGKPFPDIYQAAIEKLGGISPENICCIGDSIEHDIAGGAGAGLKTALVRSGILADETEDELERLCEVHGARPDHVIPAFAWDK